MKKYSVSYITGMIISAVLNVGSNILATLTVESGWRYIWLALGIVGLAAILYFYIKMYKNPPHVSVQFDQAITLHEEEYERHAQAGLILLLSDFSPDADSPAAKMTVDERLIAAKNLDHASLNLTKSNLNTAIVAACAHRSKLTHCWIITTKNTSGYKVSSPYAGVLVAYLKDECKMKCEFHFGVNYIVPAQDDDALTMKTYKIVSEIFTEAHDKFGLKDELIVADFTGTTKSMSMGMILACLDHRRMLQYIGSHYKDSGVREGTPFPILFKFKVKDIIE